MQEKTGSYLGRLPVKAAVLSYSYPLHPSYNRIFSGVHPDDYCILNCTPKVDFQNTALRGRYYQLGGYYIDDRKPKHRTISVWLDDFRRHCRYVVRWAKYAAAIAKSEQCGAIISSTVGLQIPIVGLLASKLANLPVVLMIFDPWRHMYKPGLPYTEAFAPLEAKFMEPLVIKYSTAVSSLNESLVDYIYQEYGLKTPILRIPYQPEALANKTDIIPKTEDNKFHILFTGGVYYSHYDTFKNLFDAIKILNSNRIVLDVYAQPKADTELVKLGGSGLFKYHGYISPEILYQKQKQADALFLPLAFNSPIPEVIRMASPTKMAEYLAAGRPMLVHAPPDAFISWYFKKNNCGIVIDELSPEKMASALTQLMSDNDHNYELGRRSLEVACRDFSPQSSYDSLCTILQTGLDNFASKKRASSLNQFNLDHLGPLLKKRWRSTKIFNLLKQK